MQTDSAIWECILVSYNPLGGEEKPSGRGYAVSMHRLPPYLEASKQCGADWGLVAYQPLHDTIMLVEPGRRPAVAQDVLGDEREPLHVVRHRSQRQQREQLLQLSQPIPDGDHEQALPDGEARSRRLLTWLLGHPDQVPQHVSCGPP